MIVLFKIVKVTKDKERLSKCHRLEDTKEREKLNVMTDPGLDLRQEA